MSKNLKEYNDFLLLTQNNGCNAKARGYVNNHPASQDLESLSRNVLENLSNLNNDENFTKEIRCDTISISKTNKNELVISGNLKERRTAPPGSNNTNSVKVTTNNGNKGRVTYDSYGFHKDELVKETVKAIKNSNIYKDGDFKIVVVEENQAPSSNDIKVDANSHAEKHAEMKTKAYAEQTEQKIETIGISKEACENCYNQLDESNVEEISPENHGSKRVTNWKQINKDEVKVVYKDDCNVKLKLASNNIAFSKRAVQKTLGDKIDNSLRPAASVGIISGIAQIVDTIERDNVETFADADLGVAKAGVTKNMLGVGKIAHARASALEMKAGVGGIVGVGASALSANAYAQYGLNNAAGVGVNIVRAQGNLGPIQAGVGLNFDCSAQVGVNGVGASFLGMGFNIGPSLQIKTPFIDFSINLF